MNTNQYEYLSGFGNEHETEALEGALPIGQFSPQKVKYDLYAEQLSTTAFTAPRASNRRSWTYRIRPSIAHKAYAPLASHQTLFTAPCNEAKAIPNQLRWNPIAMPTEATDFVDGMFTMAVNGDAFAQSGIGIHVYRCNKDMERFFYNADGELLIVPQHGSLLLRTEFGVVHVKPLEIAVIPRGVKFQVVLPDGLAGGYICENYGAPLELPERGPVGANGYANDRDFQYPVAAYEDIDGHFELVAKYGGNLFCAEIDHSPLDVVAWAGNSAPYKYELSRFNVINSVSYDHPDPSIFTVLTSQSDTPGVANVDFVIFPPRWMVTEKTFRPPWYHRNIMSEYMGLIEGVYDA